MRRLHFLVLIFALSAGCAGDQQRMQSPKEPLQFSAARPALSDIGKDFLYVAPVTISGRGEPQQYLWFAVASTVDRQIVGSPVPDWQEIILLVDDTPMNFDLAPWSEASATEPFEPDMPVVRTFGTRVTQSQLRRIARAGNVQAYVAAGDLRSPVYALVSGSLQAGTLY